ncbi:MAG TPA: glycosyltransferase [Candidatus Obscuribacterales bacterium]
MIHDRLVSSTTPPLTRTQSQRTISSPPVTPPPETPAPSRLTRSVSQPQLQGMERESQLSESSLGELQSSLERVPSERILARSGEVPPPSRMSSCRELVLYQGPPSVSTVVPPTPISPSRQRALAITSGGNVLPSGSQVLPTGTWKQALTSLASRVTSHFSPAFTPPPTGVQDTGSGPKLGTFVQSLDPFGLLQAPPGTTDSAKAKYKTLDANQSQAFLRAVSITSSSSVGGRPAPDEHALDTAIGTPMDTVSGVPKVQHSIWVGGPLKASETKHKAFMDQLVQNKLKNPGWDVCLWTDQSRAALSSAHADSDLGKMRDWAIANGINLVPVDEVFAGDNPMQLQGLYKTEQLKGGTGRAAASDIMRLEIINRFGGIYCDGDKPFNKPMDEIAQYTADHGGYTTAQESTQFQNCGMCGKPGNDITKAVIDRIQENYGKPRDSLLTAKHAQRPTRFEVILRTGPSIVRDVALESENLDITDSKKSKHLMPADFITPPKVYTTSWDPSKIPCHGDRDLVGMAGRGQALESSAQIQSRVGTELGLLRTRMQAAPGPIALTPEQETALTAAVEKGVTALVYGIWNSDGLFNMDLAEQHIKSSPNPELAREMILEVFKSPGMEDIAKQVKTLQLPGNAPTKDTPPSAIPIPESTLDAIFRTDPAVFPNLKIQDFTLQHAAFMGNTHFIDYAARNGLLDLTASSARQLETGERKGETGSFATRQMTVYEAALRGGQRDVLAVLAAQPGFGAWLKAKVDNPAPDSTNPLQLAANSGQIDTVMWAIQAMSPSDRQGLDTPDLLNRLLSVKPTPNTKLSDAERVYVFQKFAQGIRTETGQPLNLATPAFSLILSSAYETGNTRLVAEMERQGASLSHLSAPERGKLITRLQGSGIDLPAFTRPLLHIAHKGGLIPQMMTGQAGRQTPRLQTAKNEHVTAPNMNEPKEVLEFLSKGLAYADDHIARNHKGRATRVAAWRTGVANIVNELGKIPSSRRTPEQQALLEAAILTSKRLQTMKSK